MDDNAVHAYIFSRRRRGDREEAKIVMFKPDGTPFNLGGGSLGSAGPKGDTGLTGPAGAEGDPAPASGSYPVEETGFISTSYPLDAGSQRSNLGAFVTRMEIPAGKAINKVWLPVDSGPVVAGFNAFGVYDDDGNFVEQTNSDADLFSARGWRGLSLLSQIPAQANQRFVNVYANMANNLAMVCFSTPRDVINTPKFFNGIRTDRRRTWVLAPTSSMPSSIDLANGGEAFSYLLLVALS